MGIWEYKGEYFYGPRYYPEMEKRDTTIGIYTRLKEKAIKYGFKKETPVYKAPDGEECPDEWHKSVHLKEVGSLELPKRYPGYYYWVWHNGAFFKVLGETERYVLVEVDGWNFEQADTLGIDRKDVIDGYHKDQKVGKWWLQKSEIKMPDELGKGKYIYLEITPPFYMGIYEILNREGDIIRVRCDKIWIPRGKLEYIYRRIEGSIKKGVYPWTNRLDMIKEMAEIADGKVWIEGEKLYCEATFDLNHLREYRAKIKDENFGEHYLDFYLYGEEEVPYRL